MFTAPDLNIHYVYITVFRCKRHWMILWGIYEGKNLPYTPENIVTLTSIGTKTYRHCYVYVTSQYTSPFRNLYKRARLPLVPSTL
jgi:hypothetical protein